MEMIRKARRFEMVDEMGIVRELTVTVEHEPGILVEVAVPRYIDENGTYKEFIGLYVPKDTKHRRVDISQIKGKECGK